MYVEMWKMGKEAVNISAVYDICELQMEMEMGQT